MGNYITAWQERDKKRDVVVVLESENDSIKRVEYKSPYYFFEEHPDGEYLSMYRTKLRRHEFDNLRDYEAAKKKATKRKFESDFNPIKRVLMDFYYDRPISTPKFAILDIETKWDPLTTSSRPSKPDCEINAVTVYQSWTSTYYVIFTTPTYEAGCEWGAEYPIGTKWEDVFGDPVEAIKREYDALLQDKILRKQSTGVELKYIHCADEVELICQMFEAVRDSHLITGWNSEFFDVPYICKRVGAVERLHGLEENSLLSLFDYSGAPLPKEGKAEKFGSKEIVYSFQGRPHVDYMDMFKKFTFEGRSSYSLNNILLEECGIGKINYDGTLISLFRNKFATFIVYNFRDVDGIVELNNKFNFINLANQMAHENTVLLPAVLGTVEYVETGIANHAIRVKNLRVLDKKPVPHHKVEGAIVLSPQIGLHRRMMIADLKSLYPNTARTLGLSPENIVGQFEYIQDEIDNATDLIDYVKGVSRLPQYAIDNSKIVDTETLTEYCEDNDIDISDQNPQRAQVIEDLLETLAPSFREHTWLTFKRERAWEAIANNSYFDDRTDKIDGLEHIKLRPDHINGLIKLISEETDENGNHIEIVNTAQEWREILTAQKWAVSAYGTVFNQSNGRGVFDDMLGWWYDERKRLQKEKKAWGKKARQIKADATTLNDADLATLTKLLNM